MASDEQTIDTLIKDALNSNEAKDEETKLSKFLNELRQEIEERGMVEQDLNRSTSSVRVPKDQNYLRRERFFTIRNALRVLEPMQIRNLSDSMRMELSSVVQSATSDYSMSSLPLLLHEFFVERVHELVQYKHALLLRWNRFSEHTATVETLFNQFQKTMNNIMAEYMDCVQRANRLSAARECYLNEDDKGIMYVRLEDILIYLRWLISRFEGYRTASYKMKNINFLYITENSALDFHTLYENKDENNKINGLSFNLKESESIDVLTALPPNAPPSLNPLLLNAQPITPSNIAFATAASYGGGRISLGMELPVHDIELVQLKPQLKLLAHLYGIEVNVDNIHSVGEEMSLYASVIRNFNSIFHRQQRMKTFRTYDYTELGYESWGIDHSSHAIKAEATWLTFVRLIPKIDGTYERRITELRSKHNIDDLLKIKSNFIQHSDPDRVQESLRKHAKVLKDFREVSPISFPKAENWKSKEIWKKIYCNISNTKNTGENNMAGTKRAADNYDYSETVTMLGLEEIGEGGNVDESSIANGGLLSLLHLRHLRIRDLQRSCLSVLNFFRSLERTLTINDGGLSFEAGRMRRGGTGQKHRTTMDQAGGGEYQLGSHQYLHNTPLDFKQDETAFMNFQDVENHDDFYMEQEGRIHVLDQRGYFIVYDVSLDDMKNLENDLLLISTWYLEKFSLKKKVSHHIDRFGVLLDVWTSECAWLDAKKQLIDILYECYSHVFDRDERRAIAQQMTDIFYSRPRIDFDDEYFLNSYKLECAILRRKADILRNILNEHVDQRRDFCSQIAREGFKFGLPQPFLQQAPISLICNQSALKSVFLLEFHPTLSIVTQLLESLQYGYRMTLQVQQPQTTLERVLTERQFLEVVEYSLSNLQDLGFAYSEQNQKDVFSNLYMGNPFTMTMVAEECAAEAEIENVRKGGIERQMAIIERVSNILLVEHLWNNLIDAAGFCQILSPCYRRIAKELGYDECHLFMRFVQFELAGLKQNIEEPPLFITALLGDDSSVDRLVPNSLPLAINELDETHLAKLSFRSKASIMHCVKNVDTVRAVLGAQLVHKNMLVVSLLQINACCNASKPKLPSESFVSIQLEKTPSRNRMLNEFCHKKSQMGTILRNPLEMEKLKRKLIIEFCDDFGRRFQQYALRTQLILQYAAIKVILDDYPKVRENYWIIGGATEKKVSDELSSNKNKRTRNPSNSSQLTDRPRRTLSEDGKELLNIWFVPHYNELLQVYKTLEENECTLALENHLRIASTIHDILAYYTAHAKLGNVGELSAYRKNTAISADWGGTEGVGEELRNIDVQISALGKKAKSDPQLVAKFLMEKRNVLFLQVDCALRFCTCNTFLASGNMPAYKSLQSVLQPTLYELSNVFSNQPAFYKLPTDVNPRLADCRKMFPIRSCLALNGPFIESFYDWDTITDNVFKAFCTLKPVDRPIANGELLGVSLLLEDVVVDSGSINLVKTINGHLSVDENPSGRRLSSATGNKHNQQNLSQIITSTTSANRPTDPLECLQRQKAFLLLWKRVELLKNEWARRKLSLEFIDSLKSYNDFCKEYRKMILIPIISRIGPRTTNPTDDSNISLAAPPGVGEILMKREQAKRLLGSLNRSMIEDTTKKVLKDLQLVVAERQRDDNALPTDLWKDSKMKESLTASRPHIAEDFLQQVYSLSNGGNNNNNTDNDGNTTDSKFIKISKSDFDICFKHLATDVMAREKLMYENYCSYYENVLRSQHHVLYTKEREIEYLKHELKKRRSLMEIDVQCGLGDELLEILIEMADLKVTANQQTDFYQKGYKAGKSDCRKELFNLLHAMHETTLNCRERFDKFRKKLYSDAIDKMKIVQEETLNKLDDKRKMLGGISGHTTELASRKCSEKDLLSQYSRQVDEDASKHSLQQNYFELKVKFENDLKSLTDELDHLQKTLTKNQLNNQQTIVAYKMHIDTLRVAYRNAAEHGEEERKNLEKEIKNKQHKLHVAEQRARNEKRLNEARTANVDRLVEELQERAGRMKELEEEHNKLGKVTAVTAQANKKKMDEMKKKVQRERSLKIDAFQRVDELQCSVYDGEVVQKQQRPMTTMGFDAKRIMSATPSSAGNFNRSNLNRPQRPKTLGRLTNTIGGGGGGRKMSPLFPARAVTTTIGRLRSRLADQLLNDIEPPNHNETIMKLKELSTKRQEKLLQT